MQSGLRKRISILWTRRIYTQCGYTLVGGQFKTTVQQQADNVQE